VCDYNNQDMVQHIDKIFENSAGDISQTGKDRKNDDLENEE